MSLVFASSNDLVSYLSLAWLLTFYVHITLASGTRAYSHIGVNIIDNDIKLKTFFTSGYLMSQLQQLQFQQSGEVSIFRQNPPAAKTFSKSSLYAIKNGCYGPFYCPRCNNHYMWKKNLMRHMKLECGKEPSFQCPICPLRTKHKSSLLGHVRNKHFINLNAWRLIRLLEKLENFNIADSLFVELLFLN